jgi:hypothetical protein
MSETTRASREKRVRAIWSNFRGPWPESDRLRLPDYLPGDLVDAMKVADAAAAQPTPTVPVITIVRETGLFHSHRAQRFVAVEDNIVLDMVLHP